MKIDGYYTTEEAAAAHGIAASTLSKRAAARGIAGKRLGPYTLYTRAQVDVLGPLREQRILAVPEREAVAAALAAGVGVGELAFRHRVSQRTITRIRDGKA